MQLEVKPQKTMELKYLEINKEQTKNLLKNLNVSRLEKMYDWCFQSQRTASKGNETFLAVINKEIRHAWCI